MNWRKSQGSARRRWKAVDVVPSSAHEAEHNKAMGASKAQSQRFMEMPSIKGLDGRAAAAYQRHQPRQGLFLRFAAAFAGSDLQPLSPASAAITHPLPARTSQ
jgi:hypothetical protein